jgi:hypothetical protein
MRCSFEETVEILLEAAAFGELDDWSEMMASFAPTAPIRP